MAVMGRIPVFVKGGRYLPIELEGNQPGPVALSRTLLDVFGRLHYIDILGIMRENVDWDVAKAIMDQGEVWADVGIRGSDNVIDAIMAGASEAVVATKVVRSLEDILQCFEITENMILQLDLDGGVISQDQRVSSMEPLELIDEMTAIGIERFIIDDHSEGGTLSTGLVEKIAERIPAGGGLWIGVDDLRSVERLMGTGVSGAIISCSRLMEGVE